MDIGYPAFAAAAVQIAARLTNGVTGFYQKLRSPRRITSHIFVARYPVEHSTNYMAPAGLPVRKPEICRYVAVRSFWSLRPKYRLAVRRSYIRDFGQRSPGNERGYFVTHAVYRSVEDAIRGVFQAERFLQAHGAQYNTHGGRWDLWKAGLSNLEAMARHYHVEPPKEMGRFSSDAIPQMPLMHNSRPRPSKGRYVRFDSVSTTSPLI